MGNAVVSRETFSRPEEKRHADVPVDREGAEKYNGHVATIVCMVCNFVWPWDLSHQVSRRRVDVDSHDPDIINSGLMQVVYINRPFYSLV